MSWGCCCRCSSPAPAGGPVTTYFSFVNGPRLPDELDGPDEVHVVVLDNGRSDILGGRYRSILHCIRCGGVPERLPRLPAGRRPRLRQRVRRADRRGPDAAAGRVRGGGRPPARLVAVRRVHRGLPGEDPAARTPAGAAQGRRRLPREAGRTAMFRGWSVAWQRAGPTGGPPALARVGQAPFARGRTIRRAPWPFSRWTRGRDLPAVARGPSGSASDDRGGR